MQPAGKRTLQESIPVLGPKEIPVDHLVTEDDTPVDNMFCERQQRLFVESLYGSWPGPGKGRKYLALANVGLFYSPDEDPVVPDFLLSLDVKPVKPGKPPLRKRGRSYFTWVFGKVPEVVIEVVSNRKGGEADFKLSLYAQIGVLYYVIFDPEDWLHGDMLRVFRLHRKRYQPMRSKWLGKVGLGLTLWHGEYQSFEDEWLRWCDRQGNIFLTGAERAAQTSQRADRLADQLRRLGVEPET